MDITGYYLLPNSNQKYKHVAVKKQIHSSENFNIIIIFSNQTFSLNYKVSML